MATETLGPEHDRRLLRAVKWALRKSGARPLRQGWALFGSQEITRQQWTTPDGLVTLTGETYMGLVIDGPDAVVEEVMALVRGRLR